MADGEETFRVAVKDHVMIAHSLQGEVFGPAQRMHGATYEVITEYASGQLDENGIVRWHSEGIQKPPDGHALAEKPNQYTIIEAIEFARTQL